MLQLKSDYVLCLSQWNFCISCFPFFNVNASSFSCEKTFFAIFYEMLAKAVIPQLSGVFKSVCQWKMGTTFLCRRKTGVDMWSDEYDFGFCSVRRFALCTCEASHQLFFCWCENPEASTGAAPLLKLHPVTAQNRNPRWPVPKPFSSDCQANSFLNAECQTFYEL